MLAAAGIHNRCAKALEVAGAGQIEIAHHVLGAVPLVSQAEAVTRARATASWAVDDKQFDAAIRLLENVLSSPLEVRDRAEVLVELGQAGNGAGRAVQAAPLFEEAADLARQHGWAYVLVDAAIGHYGSSPYRKPRSTLTLELLAEADALVGEAPSLAKARVLAKTGAFSMVKLPLSVCDEMTARALEMVPDAGPRHRLELLEFRATVFMNPAGVYQLEALDHELERLRTENDIFAADAAVPEPRVLMLGRGDELRFLARSDQARIRAQPIAEWRDLILRSTLSAFDNELEAARRFCDEAGSIGQQYWGDAAASLHAVGQVFIAILGGDWDRPIELLEGLLENDPTQLLILHAAWAHLADGNRRRGLELSRMVRLEHFGRHSTYPLGGNALIAAAEVALLLDNDEWAAVAERHLEPFAELMLGLPWACSLAAADSLARLARRRGDEASAAAHTATACRLYESLRAPALLARLESSHS